MPFATPLAAVALSFALAVQPLAARQEPVNDGKREFTLTGCLLRAGYAGYQMEGVTVDTIDGKPVPAAFKDAVAAAEEVDPAGRRQPWPARRRESAGCRPIRLAGEPAAQPDEPPKPPTLEVKITEDGRGELQLAGLQAPGLSRPQSPTKDRRPRRHLS